VLISESMSIVLYEPQTAYMKFVVNRKFETLEFDSSAFQTIGCNCKLIPSKDVSYLA